MLMSITTAPVTEMVAFIESYGDSFAGRKANLYAKYGQTQALRVLFTAVRRTAA